MGRRGAVLLEVLAALTILAFAGVGTLALLAQLADTEARAEATVWRLTDEDRLMTAYVLLNREDLDRRLGTRAVGAYLVEVQRPRTDLYRIAIGDSAGADLVTLVHRPEPHRALP